MNDIEVRYHHIRELLINKKLEVQKIDTKVNIVDCQMKLLPDHLFRALRITRAESNDGGEESKVEEPTG